jgi:hypothetical protein
MSAEARQWLAYARENRQDVGLDPALTEDEADLLDTVYLPSKYPLGSVLPAFEPADFPKSPKRRSGFIR